MKCGFQGGFIAVYNKIEELKKKTIKILMEDNGVSENDLKEEKYKINIDNRGSKTQKYIFLLDSNSELVDGYRMEYSFSREGVRVEVFKV